MEVAEGRASGGTTEPAYDADERVDLGAREDGAEGRHEAASLGDGRGEIGVGARALEGVVVEVARAGGTAARHAGHGGATVAIGAVAAGAGLAVEGEGVDGGGVGGGG